MIGNNIADEIKKSQEVHHRILHRQLHMKHKVLALIEKYQKNIYVYICRNPEIWQTIINEE